MVFSSVGALGYLLLLVTNIPAVNYIGLFLAASGMYPLIPVVVSWGANNVGGSLKKGVATAIIVSVGNAGGVLHLSQRRSTSILQRSRNLFGVLCLGIHLCRHHGRVLQKGQRQKGSSKRCSTRTIHCRGEEAV